MAKPTKVTAVAELADQFRSSSAAVVTEYRGLSMAQLTKLRRALGAGTKYTVAKNTPDNARPLSRPRLKLSLTSPRSTSTALL